MQEELFRVDEFRTALERYGVWPITVWPCDMTDQKTRRLKELIGDCDESSTRSGSFTKETHDMSVYRGKITVSIFNPAVASWIINCFAPPAPCLVLDPFAGGGTRAIIAAKAGYNYIGLELRAEEVAAIRERCDRLEIENVEIIQIDSCSTRWSVTNADFLITCPPYWNLEQYNGGAGDISMAPTYKDFLQSIEKCVSNSREALKSGALSAWVIGLHRDKDGSLLAMHHDLARLHLQNGFKFREEIILHQQNNGAIQRVGNFDKGSKRLVRVHEYVLVFQKE